MKGRSGTRKAKRMVWKGERYAKRQVVRLGRHGNEGKAEPRDTLGRKLVILYVCVLAISNRCSKTVPVPIRG
jgi:hypothetical protein